MYIYVSYIPERPTHDGQGGSDESFDDMMIKDILNKIFSKCKEKKTHQQIHYTMFIVVMHTNTMFS